MAGWPAPLPATPRRGTCCAAKATPGRLGSSRSLALIRNCSPPARRQAHHANGSFRVGYVGRLEHKKGVQVLVAACGQLGTGVRLDLLGWGPEERRLRALAAACGLEERLHIHTARASTEVPAFLRQLDVLVLPSLTTPQWKEQFGRVLVEAMACETAVIGSDSGEIRRVIGDAGRLFPEGNSAALAEQLVRLRDDPALRRELGARGRLRVLAHYTQQRIAERTWEAYQSVAPGVMA